MITAMIKRGHFRGSLQTAHSYKKGYTRVQEKVDDICQDFTTAVTTDKEDGNEKMVAGFY